MNKSFLYFIDVHRGYHCTSSGKSRCDHLFLSYLHTIMANKKGPLIIKPRLDQLYILAIHKISVTTKKLKAMNNYACVLILVIAHSYDLSWTTWLVKQGVF